MGYKRHKQPEGAITRGKTAPNRLRRVDTFLCHVDPGWFARRADTLVVDLGYGRVPQTTLELAHCLWRLNPAQRILGVEIDPERVEAAQEYATELLQFVRGGFDIVPPKPVRMIRAMNVLRQYPEEAVREAYRAMGAHLVDGGWLVEGTCHPLGRTMVVQLSRKRGDHLFDAGLLFSTNFRAPCAPEDFQPVLPKQFIHRVVAGNPIYDFLGAWQAAWMQTPPTFGNRYRFAQAGRLLAATENVDRRRWLLRRGYLWWRR